MVLNTEGSNIPRFSNGKENHSYNNNGTTDPPATRKAAIPPITTSLGEWNTNGGGDATPDRNEMEQDNSEKDKIGTFQKYIRGERSAAVTIARITPTNKQNGEATKSTVILSSPSALWVFFRTLLFDVPLAVVFFLFLVAWFLQSLHYTYYIPLMVRSHRNDEYLLEEHTYYERQCNKFDVTTYDMEDMMLQTSNQSTADAVDRMMRHGLTVVPQILTPDAVADLRDYIERRNEAIPRSEEYPMSQGYQRLSYGIEPTEDPAVARAVQQVATHPVFRPLIAALLGDEDPASSEITAITNFPGCSLQGWHQDTKQDGNALKFARTFSHSYSLFLPLQNVTALMGGTDVCPGTHYCANDLADMCEYNKLGMADVDPEYGFPAGAGALLNQHVWHRGGAHSDYHAPARIIFIVSFLARPKFDRDPRQLSRGTYFHQKWSMWGHTINDMLDPFRRMRPPFSYLRAMSIWKPAAAHWGYDLITSGFMRIANEQMEFDEFVERFLPRLDQLHFPRFLWGEIIHDGSQITMWSFFIRDTLQKCFQFTGLVALGSHVLFLTYLAVYAYRNRKRHYYTEGPRPVCRSLARLVCVQGFLFMCGLSVWLSIRQSNWGVNVRSGRMLQRPFPTVSSMRFLETQTVPSGLTTMPTGMDVLIGTRFDADFLGSYDRWLDYHPANLHFQEMMDEYASSYVLYQHSTSPNFRAGVIRRVVREIRASDGRFLQQDFRTGNWRILNDKEIAQTVSDHMLFSRVEWLRRLIQYVDRSIAEQRFGFGRESHRAMYTHLLLWQIRKAILARPDVVGVPLPAHQKKRNPLPFQRITRFTQPPWPSLATPVPSFEERYGWSLPDEDDEDHELYFPGASVWWTSPETQRWLPGTILGTNGPWLHVSANDFGYEVHTHRHSVHKVRPITEGDRLIGCMQEDFQDCYPGAVFKVLPGGEVSMQFDDGDFEEFLPPDRYYQPPFVYPGPIPA